MTTLVNIQKYLIIVGFICIPAKALKAQGQIQFATILEILDFTKSNNHQFKNADWQTKLAELASKTAVINQFNPKIPTSIQALDNITQQVSFLPGQAFGQPAGTYKEVVIGQQFVSTLSIQPQFDIINLANYAQVNLAKTNQLLVENQNKINELNLYEKINSVYFTILSFTAQKDIIIENIAIAEDIFRIIQNKFKDGLSRKQEVNETEVNLISLQDKLEQIELNMDLQYQTLQLFLETDVDAKLTENLWDYDNSIDLLATENKLFAENAKLQHSLVQQEYKGLRYQNYPILSFVSSFNWQNLSNDFSFSRNSNWINYNFIGLKLTYDLPTTVAKYTNLKSKKIQLELVKNNELFSQNESEIRLKLMLMEYEKALKQKESYTKIYTLKKDTYEKNFNQFIENILPLDKLLISQNDLVVSKLNIVLSLANIGFNKTKIVINNKF